MLLSTTTSVSFSLLVDHNFAYIPPFSINFSCVPDSTICPRSRTTILSAFRIVVKRCAIIKTVLCFFKFDNASCILFSVVASKAAVASSKIIIGGSCNYYYD